MKILLRSASPSVSESVPGLTSCLAELCLCTFVQELYSVHDCVRKISTVCSVWNANKKNSFQYETQIKFLQCVQYETLIKCLQCVQYETLIKFLQFVQYETLIKFLQCVQYKTLIKFLQCLQFETLIKFLQCVQSLQTHWTKTTSTRYKYKILVSQQDAGFFLYFYQIKLKYKKRIQFSVTP